MRPTLRLRLTLLNGILLVGAGAILVLLAWLLVGDALHPADELRPGTQVVLTDGSTLDAADWQRQLVSAAS
ncbi:two-component sensor histidine kinase, partial [Actinoplanes sp. NPDC051633]